MLQIDQICKKNIFTFKFILFVLCFEALSLKIIVINFFYKTPKLYNYVLKNIKNCNININFADKGLI